MLQNTSVPSESKTHIYPKSLKKIGVKSLLNKVEQQPLSRAGSRRARAGACSSQHSPSPCSFTDAHSALELKSLNEFSSMQADKDVD